MLAAFAIKCKESLHLCKHNQSCKHMQLLNLWIKLQERYFMKKLILGLIALASSASFAGNGSSGGGNIFGDQLNPWFLQNTKTVTYCIEVDQSFASIDRSQISNVVERSIDYWKRTFTNYSGNFQYDFNFNVKLATQDFIQTDCLVNTDIRFQFGFLTDDQKKQIPNYRQLIGLAYRTSFDDVNLKAKGFIYIAPELGNLRPQSPNMHQFPWSHGKNVGLELVLTHELGHIFGLQDDHYSHSGLMSAKFAEQITSKEGIRFVNSEPRKEIPSPFGCNKSFDGEHEMEIEFQDIPGKSHNHDIRTELGLPTKFKAKFLSSNFLMKIFVDNKEFGKIYLKEFGEISGGSADPAITVYLTKKQNVFSRLPTRAYNTHLLAYHVDKNITKKGEVLNLVDGRTFKVFINYDQSCIPAIGMSYQDEVYMDIFSGL